MAALATTAGTILQVVGGVGGMVLQVVLWCMYCVSACSRAYGMVVTVLLYTWLAIAFSALP